KAEKIIVHLCAKAVLAIVVSGHRHERFVAESSAGVLEETVPVVAVQTRCDEIACNRIECCVGVSPRETNERTRVGKAVSISEPDKRKILAIAFRFKRSHIGPDVLRR